MRLIKNMKTIFSSEKKTLNKKRSSKHCEPTFTLKIRRLILWMKISKKKGEN